MNGKHFNDITITKVANGYVVILPIENLGPLPPAFMDKIEDLQAKSDRDPLLEKLQAGERPERPPFDPTDDAVFICPTLVEVFDLIQKTFEPEV